MGDVMGMVMFDGFGKLPHKLSYLTLGGGLGVNLSLHQSQFVTIWINGIPQKCIETIDHSFIIPSYPEGSPKCDEFIKYFI